MSFEELPLRSPADMVAAVPYLLGFHPHTGSVVAIVINHHKIVVVGRADLPTVNGYTAEFDSLCQHLATVVGEDNSTGVLLIGYGPGEDIDADLHQLTAQLDHADLPVIGVLRLTGNRVFTITCTEPGCCPPDGTPVDLQASPVAAQATVMGLVALPDRDAVAAKITPVTGAARTHIQHATQAARARLDTLRASGADLPTVGHDALLAALGRHDLGQHLDDDQAAWLTVLLADQPLRVDALVLTGAELDRLGFWIDLTRRADPTLMASPALVLAITAWRCGDGPLAVAAIQRALETDPADSLITSVASALRSGMSPQYLEQAIEASAAAAEELR